MAGSSSRYRYQFSIALVLALLLAAILGGHTLVTDYYVDDEKASQQTRLSVYRTSLIAELRRYDYLPQVIAQNPSVFSSLEDAEEKTSMMLKNLMQTAGVEAIYVLSREGLTLASSNFQDANSFVGKNYGFRPYFRQAMTQGYGRFYGIGATTKRPGYFVAAPIPARELAKAVVALKFELGTLEKSWSAGKEHVFVSDNNGVINLSSVDDWRYTTLSPLTSNQLDAIRAQKQFSDEPLTLLSRQVEDLETGIVQIKDKKYLESVVDIDIAGWRLHSLLPYEIINERLISFWTRILTGVLIGLAILLISRIIRTRVALRNSLGESSQLRQLNRSLEQEIEERIRVEQELLQAQKDLKLSSKLAAMGQLAASITHELNQPLSAMRTYTVSLKESLRLSNASDPTETASETKLIDVSTTVTRLSSLIDRMTAITQQLRVFARSRDKEMQNIDLNTAIEGALNTMAPMLIEADIECIVDKPEDAIVVMAGRIRMEQVLVNLLRNAVDAILEMPEQEAKRIDIRLKCNDQDTIELSVGDTGPGVKQEIVDSLFEPFASTKPSGQGMGLGLAISSNIIAEMKGELRAENRPEGGALFTIQLQRVG